MSKESEIQKIITWLMTYPDFDDTFDVARESTDQLVDFLGTDIIETMFYVRMGQKERRRNDYLIQVAKPVLFRSQRADNADFLVAFQKWVSDQSVKNLVPELGNYGRQKTWVDAQQYVEVEESSEMAFYQLQLHIEYTVLE